MTENNNTLIQKNIELFDIEESYKLIGKSKKEIIDLYGTSFENVPEGVEGIYHGLHYKELGVIFAMSDDIVRAVYLDDSASIKGTYLDLTIYDVQDILGENEIQSIMTEGQEYWLFYEYDNYTIQFRTMESLNKLEDISIVLPGKHFGHWQ